MTRPERRSSTSSTTFTSSTALLSSIQLLLISLPSVLSYPSPTPVQTNYPPLPTTYEELLSLLSSKDHPGMIPGAEQAGVLASLTRDKWIGIGLAVSSSLAIGISSIITKKVSLSF